MPPTMDEARSALARYFGYDEFRAGQVDVVASVLSGRDTLGVLPTGGGKSLCYQVPALVLPGMTIVISPLISLMKDQVDRLVAKGIAASLLNSTLAPADVAERMERITRGGVKLLYVAPERFESPDLGRALSGCEVSLLAVDEAHCISEWGHDFRPSFRRIAGVNRRLGRKPVVALTATATPAVREDIGRQLELRTLRVIVSGFDRENLSYEVRHCRTDDEKHAALLAVLRSRPRPAIVYAATRATVERVARRLGRAGLPALPYHGGLGSEHRHETQERFMRGAVDIIVATNAFGMGIDKPDVRLVVHFAMPGTLEAYYQEAGRAGRDGRPGHCLLLCGADDHLTHEWFLAGMYPERAVVQCVWDRLCATHVSGEVRSLPTDRAEQAAVRLLQSAGALTARPRSRQRYWVRLLATPTRIARELASGSDERALLRAMWRSVGAALEEGTVIDFSTLRRVAKRSRTIREAAERLRASQFIDLGQLGTGIFLTRPDAPLDTLRIDWESLERRRAAEQGKLRMMRAYTTTPNCRRAFVLRYFGDRSSKASCGGCDNCLQRSRGFTLFRHG
jgi:ATP-dependent DNA helicase RecQ